MFREKLKFIASVLLMFKMQGKSLKIPSGFRNLVIVESDNLIT